MENISKENVLKNGNYKTEKCNNWNKSWLDGLDRRVEMTEGGISNLSTDQ